MSNRRQTGVRKLHYAILQPGGTYSAPKPIIGLQEISTTNNYSEYAFYSDNQIDASGKALSSVEISLTLKGLDPQIEAELMGKDYDSTTGVMTTSATDSAKEVALLYEITCLEGQPSYYRCLYSCKLFRDEMGNTTQGESIESSDVTLTGVAVPRAKDGVVERTVDAEVAGATTIVSTFFTKVYEPGAEA